MMKSALVSLVLHGVAVAVAFFAWQASAATAAERLPFQVSFSHSPAQLVPTPPEPAEPVELEPEESPIEVETVDLEPVDFDPVIKRREPLASAPLRALSARLPRPLRIPKPQVLQQHPVTAPAAHVESPPEPHTCPRPSYPALARRMGHQGTVRVRVTISATGGAAR